MIIEEKRSIPKEATEIKFFWEGSGLPQDMHYLLGIGMYDEKGMYLAGIGDVDHKVEKVEDYRKEEEG